MSEVYLTKVERKTIFTQGLIYVFLMFVISDFMVVGPAWFKLFPWLYFLGLIAKSKFSKPVLALVIACFTTFISALLKTEGLTLEVMIVTLNSIFMVTAGVITGTYIFDLKLSHRLVKFIPRNKKIYMMLVSIFITLIVIAVNSYINGDAYTYVKTRTSINEYIKETYNENSFKIKSIKYELVNFNPQYTYELKIQDEDVNVRYTFAREFEDMNYESRMLKGKTLFNSNIKNKIINITAANKYIYFGNINFELEFSKSLLKPDRLEVYIQTNTDEDFKEKNNVYDEIISTIKKIDQLEDVKEYEREYIITCNDNVANIKQKKIMNLTIRYLENSFETDELSQI